MLSAKRRFLIPPVVWSADRDLGGNSIRTEKKSTSHPAYIYALFGH